MNDIRQPAPSLKPIAFSSIQMTDEEAERRLKELEQKKILDVEKHGGKGSKNEPFRKSSASNEPDIDA